MKENTTSEPQTSDRIWWEKRGDKGGEKRVTRDKERERKEREEEGREDEEREGKRK